MQLLIMTSSATYHVDLYRLESVNETDMSALGLADAFTKGGSHSD
jgi:hypothetical protein